MPITPKVAVNMATAQATRLASGGNNFEYYAPVVWRELYEGKIEVFLPNKSGTNEKRYFNISVQGA